MRWPCCSPPAWPTPVSILIGTLMGRRWLAEGEAGRRVPGAVAIVAGLAALSAG